MKTAISIPDDTFARADGRAAELGLSRSEFVTRAIRRYLEELDAESITDQIDATIALLADDDSAMAAAAAGRRILARDEDTW